MQLRHQATLTHPLQWVLQHHVANLHVSTRILATEHDNNHAAIPMRFATTDSKKAKNYARRNNHSLQNTEEELKRPQPHPRHTGGTFHRRLQPLYTEKYKVSCSGFLPKTKPMQHSCSHDTAFCSITWLTCISLRPGQRQMGIIPPFQCDLQPQIQEMHRTTRAGTTTRCRTQRRNRNDPSRTRGTQEVPFIASCSHCTRKNTRFRAPASSPKQSPCNIHAAITMRFAASRRKLAQIYYTHMATEHDNNHAAIPMRSEPQIQGTQRTTRTGTTTRCRTQRRNRNDPSRTRRTQEVPFIAGCSHFTRKSTRFRAPASSPKQSPCNIQAAIIMRFAASRG